MKEIKNIIVKVALLLVLGSCPAISFCSNYSTILSLTSTAWKFNLGDDMAWAQSNFNDKDWESIYAGRSWENQGYVAYDGFAWYRKKVSFPELDQKKTIILHIDNIDDCDEVYFNGSLIGKTGQLPSQYLTGYGWERNYIIPARLINRFGENQIAVRVYDDTGDGGITGRRMTICYDENEKYLDFNLSGEWKISFNEYKNWKSPDYKDSHWRTVLVPMSWESQGYFNYDGYVCYRKTFTLPAGLAKGDMYLSLGKIDDYDKAYLNGEYIGELSASKNKSEFSRHRGEYYTERVYEIPDKLLREGENVICVKVYDEQQVGGIYEGPVGIMTKANLKLYKSKAEEDWDDENYNLGDLFEDIFDEIFY